MCGKSWIVNEGISIALVALDDIVAVQLKGRDRIISIPLQKQLKHIAVAAHGAARPYIFGQTAAAITQIQVHDHPSHIAFELIARVPVALGSAVRGGTRSSGKLPTAPTGVSASVTGSNVVDIGTGSSASQIGRSQWSGVDVLSVPIACIIAAAVFAAGAVCAVVAIAVVVPINQQNSGIAPSIEVCRPQSIPNTGRVRKVSGMGAADFAGQTAF